MTTTFEYDSANRRLSMTEAAGRPERRIHRWHYDNNGNVLSETLQPPQSPGQHAIDWFRQSRTTEYRYDALNRQTHVVQGGVSAKWSGEHGISIEHGQTLTLLGTGLPGLPTTVRQYDAANNVVGVTDPRGVVSEFTFDARNRQTKAELAKTVPVGVAAPSGGAVWTKTEYDNLDRVQTVTRRVNDHALVTTRTVYDRRGQIEELIEAEGSITDQRSSTFSYDAADRLVSETRGMSRVRAHRVSTDYQYDTLGRRVLVTGASHLSSAANGAEQLADLKHLRPVTRTVYDALGRVREVHLPIGQGGVLKTSISRFEYDPLGRQTRVTEGVVGGEEARRRESSFSYDLADNVVWQKDGRGVETEARFDAFHRRTAIRQEYDFKLLRTTLAYNVFDQMTKQETPVGTTTFEFDRLGRLRKVVDPFDRDDFDPTTPDVPYTSYSYDLAGNQIAQDRYVGKKKHGPATARDRQTDRTSYRYDALNRRIQMTDAATHSALFVPQGRGVAHYQYDALGRLSGVVDRNGAYRRLTHDLLGRQTAETWFASATIVDGVVAPGWEEQTLRYEYDGMDNLRRSFIDRPGEPTRTTERVTERTYDGLNRVRSESAPGVYRLTFTYDAGSRRIRVEDSLDGMTSSVYDGANRLRSRHFDMPGIVDRRTIVINYKVSGGREIDLVHSVTSHKGLVATPNHQVYSREYEYDPLGRTTQIEYARPANGAATGAVTEKLVYGYNASGLQDRLERAPGGLASGQTGNVFHYRLETRYDTVGQVRQEARQIERITLRSPEAQEPPKTRLYWPRPESWDRTYDATGNHESAESIVEHGERLLQDSEWRYRYDREGRLIGKIRQDRSNLEWINQWRYTYDIAGHLTSVQGWKGNRIDPTRNDAAALEVSYRYDAEGRLIARTEFTAQPYQETEPFSFVSSSLTFDGPPVENRPKVTEIQANPVRKETRYAYDGTRVWADLEGGEGHALRVRYLLGDGVDEVYARQGVIRNGYERGTLWYGTDSQGSVLHIIGESGRFYKRVRYRSGQADLRDTGEGFEDRYEYTGREYDRRTRMQYHNARWYDPSSGRWTSEDPLREMGGDYNLYRYAGNSAPNFTDRNGMFWSGGIVTGAGAAIGAVGGFVAGGMSGTDGWSWERALAGAGSGALVGVGVGMFIDTFGASTPLTAALIGAGIGAGVGSAYGGGLLSDGGRVNWVGYGVGGAVGGAMGALAGYGAASTLAMGTAGGQSMAGLLALQSAKAAVGAAHGGLSAAFHGGGMADVGVGALTGGAFGFADPTMGTFLMGGAAVTGAGVGWGVSSAGGDERWIRRGWDIGGIVGGLASAYRNGVSLASGECNQTWRAGVRVAGWEAAGGALAAGGTYALTGDGDAALGAWGFGQMGAGLSPLASRRLREALYQVCFCGEMLLDVPGGKKRIDQIEANELVLARDEHDVNSEIEAKVVEEVFRRWGRVGELHLADGQVIRTTLEHRFFERNKGWIAVELLEAGDWLRLRQGWVRVERVVDTGKEEWVYNIRVSGYHTYFVSATEWGIAVWAHNECRPEQVRAAIQAEMGRPTRLGPVNLQRVADAVNDGQVDVAAGILRNTVSRITDDQAQRIAQQLHTNLEAEEARYAEIVYRAMASAARANAPINSQARRSVEGAYHPGTGTVGTRMSGGGESQDPAHYPHITFPPTSLTPDGRPATTCALGRAGNDVCKAAGPDGVVYVSQGEFFWWRGDPSAVPPDPARLQFRTMCENCAGTDAGPGTVTLTSRLRLLPLPPGIIHWPVGRPARPGEALDITLPPGW